MILLPITTIGLNTTISHCDVLVDRVGFKGAESALVTLK